jgi:hypothetical protein
MMSDISIKSKAVEMKLALRTFFSSQRFAVAGASSDSLKYERKGTRIYDQS